MVARGRTLWMFCLLTATALAGCSGDGGGATPGPTDDDDEMEGAGDNATAGLFTYATGHPAGDVVTQTYDETLTADEQDLLLYRFDTPIGGSCCSFDGVDGSDLFQQDRMVHMRINLTWTNTPENQADLYLAPCVPYFCTIGQDGDGMPPAAGEHTETMEFVTGGVGDDADHFLGVRYENAAVTTGLSYTLDVTVTPYADALVLFDPYEVTVPDNGTLQAELLSPPGQDGMVGLTLYADDDRPFSFASLEGASGELFDLGVGAGTYVVVPMAWNGALVRLYTDQPAGSLTARQLPVDFEIIQVATISDHQATDGTYEYEAPPGVMQPFPDFIQANPGAHAAGLVSRGFYGEVAGSGGVVSALQDHVFGTRDPVLGQFCFSCSGIGEWNPENIVDDDGVYQFVWENTEQTGDVVLYSVWYLR